METTTGKESTMQNKLVTRDEIVGYDHTGWPLYHLRIMSLLRALQVREDIIQQIPEEILKMHVTSIEDDGKGMGVNSHELTECWVDWKKGEVYVYRL